MGISKKVIGFLFLFAFNYSFAFVDNDLDGVDDSIDKCPNTPFDQIVGQDGCPIKKLDLSIQKRKNWRFYFKTGIGYNKDSSTESLFSALSLAYAYKGFYTSWSSNYYLYDNVLNTTGLGDSFFYISYSWFLINNIYFTAGLNTKVPTGNNKFSDGYFDFSPSVNFDYIRGKDDYFIFYSHTFKGNPDLKDIDSFSIGVGYQLTKNFYSSLSFDGVSSSITGDFRYQISYFGLYNFSREYYSTLSYSYGLNNIAVDHSIFIKFGVRF